MRRWPVLAVCALISCNGGGDDWTRSGCDPLDPSVCSLPWPSSYFMEEAETPSGMQVAFGETSLPENRDDVQTRPDFLNEKDGFPPMGRRSCTSRMSLSRA